MIHRVSFENFTSPCIRFDASATGQNATSRGSMTARMIIRPHWMNRINPDRALNRNKLPPSEETKVPALGMLYLLKSASARETIHFAPTSVAGIITDIRTFPAVTTNTRRPRPSKATRMSCPRAWYMARMPAIVRPIVVRTKVIGPVAVVIHVMASPFRSTPGVMSRKEVMNCCIMLMTPLYMDFTNSMTTESATFPGISRTFFAPSLTQPGIAQAASTMLNIISPA